MSLIHVDEAEGIRIAEKYRERVVSPEILKAEKAKEASRDVSNDRA